MSENIKNISYEMSLRNKIINNINHSLNNEKIDNFVEYFKSFYDPEHIGAPYPMESLNEIEILEALLERIENNNIVFDTDTYDREVVRDIVLEKKEFAKNITFSEASRENKNSSWQTIYKDGKEIGALNSRLINTKLIETYQFLIEDGHAYNFEKVSQSEDEGYSFAQFDNFSAFITGARKHQQLLDLDNETFCYVYKLKDMNESFKTPLMDEYEDVEDLGIEISKYFSPENIEYRFIGSSIEKNKDTKLLIEKAKEVNHGELIFITNEQKSVLSSLYLHQYNLNHNKEKTEENFEFYSKQLDELGVPWSIQNQVAFMAEKKEDGGKYLSTLMAEKDIYVPDSACYQVKKNEDLESSLDDFNKNSENTNSEQEIAQ